MKGQSCISCVSKYRLFAVAMERVLRFGLPYGLKGAWKIISVICNRESLEKYSRHLLLREFGKLFTPSVSRIHQGFVLDTFFFFFSSTSRYICTKFGIYLPENLFKHALVLQRQSIFRYTGITFLSTRNPIQEAALMQSEQIVFRYTGIAGCPFG